MLEQETLAFLQQIGISLERALFIRRNAERPERDAFEFGNVVEKLRCVSVALGRRAPRVALVIVVIVVVILVKVLVARLRARRIAGAAAEQMLRQHSGQPLLLRAEALP